MGQAAVMREALQEAVARCQAADDILRGFADGTVPVTWTHLDELAVLLKAVRATAADLTVRLPQLPACPGDA